MPRTLWTGSLSFGLVNVPGAGSYSAARDLDLHFRQLHAKDDSADRAAPLLLEGGRGGRRGRRSRAATSSTASRCADRRGAERSVEPRKTRTIDIESFVELGGGRPDLLRPPLLPAPGGRDRGHRARLPAAGRGDGVRPTGRRSGRFVLRTKEYLVRDPRARRRALADDAAVRTTRCAHRRDRRPAGAKPSRRSRPGGGA